MSNDRMSQSAPESKQTKDNEGGLWSSFFYTATSGLSKLIGLTNGPKIPELEEALIQSGPLVFSKDLGGYTNQTIQPIGRLENELISCFYIRTTLEVNGDQQLRETLDIVRKDMSGGAILHFTDGMLVGGITNAIERLFFRPEEETSALQMLIKVRKEFKENQYE